MQNTLQKANEYVQMHRVKADELPAFHVAPVCGWMNDPNGFSMYQGKVHLFYQHHPYSTEWGPMHWGHCVSEDFIKWDCLPDALAPEDVFDHAGCFSGTGMESDAGHVLYYTGVTEKEIDGKKFSYQDQCVAIGDGKTYTKLKSNPVVTGAMLPEGFSKADFRDPKVWKEGDIYYMIAGNRTEQNVPQIVLFSSENGLDWKYESVFASNADAQLGIMWECPDFFHMDGQDVLVFSPTDMCASGEFHNGHNTVYVLGKFDKENGCFCFDGASAHTLDDGLDYYAAQTMETPDGRRILIGWMQSWHSNIRPDAMGWAGMMTIPRELEITDGRLVQRPVREIEKYRQKPVCYENKEVNGSCELPGVSGRMVDMTVEITGGDYRAFTIAFAKNEEHCTSLEYRRDKQTLELDRTYSGMTRDTIASRKIKLKMPKEHLKLRFILDKYSAEIFVNDGEQVISTTFYTPLTADEIRFESDGMADINVQKYDVVVE